MTSCVKLRRVERSSRRGWVGNDTAKKPTDRGKLGTKRSVLTDARGVLLGLAVSGANTYDIRLLEASFDNQPFKRPQPTTREQHVCLDKGYDSEDASQLIRWEKKSNNYVAMLQFAFTHVAVRTAGVLG